LNWEPEKITGDTVLRSADMLLRLHNAYPATKSARLNINVSDKYNDLKYQDLIKELKTTRHNTERLLSELEPK
jgi:hypothetical protein